MSRPIPLKVKVLSIQYSERYSLRRVVTLAQQELQKQHPGLEAEISEVGDPAEIGKYAFVLVLPSLVINEKTVCSGCYPTKDEVIVWLREAAGLRE